MSNLHRNSSSNVKTEFDAACIDIYGSAMRRSLLGAPGQDLLPRFAQSYQKLLALPRRARRSLQRQWKRTLGGVALLLALTPGASFAATMNVAAGVAPDVNADGKCSLIEAIVNANNNKATSPDCPAGSGKDTINLPANSKQTLARSFDTTAAFYLRPGHTFNVGLAEIRSPIVIEGRNSTIDVADTSGVEVVVAVSANGNLTLNQTTVSGSAGGDASAYGGVLNRGILRLSNSRIEGTSGFQYMGGLINEGGTASVLKSTISGNGSSGSGDIRGYDAAGIRNTATGTLKVVNSIVSDNGTRTGFSSAYTSGGIDNRGKATIHDTHVTGNYWIGVFNQGEITISDSRISDGYGNSVSGFVNHGVAVVTKTTVSDNVSWYNLAEYRGAGIKNMGTLTLVNSTVSGNSTGDCSGIAAYGPTTLIHTTVTNNYASLGLDPYIKYGKGGAGLCALNSATVTLQRSVISGNKIYANLPTATREITAYVTRHGSGTPVIIANDFNLFGYNNKSGVKGFTPGPTDIVPTKPVSGILMPLANNGGANATHALAISSPALNAAPVDALCTSTDQRNNPRPQGVKCDIGSFEGSAVLCNGLVTTQVGTSLADTLTGTAGRDVIAGLTGNDTIRGLNGNDVICAGSGADKVYGGNNNDLLFGDANNDKLYGDAGNDALNGGTGTDLCNGGTGTDTATQCETRTSVP